MKVFFLAQCNVTVHIFQVLNTEFLDSVKLNIFALFISQRCPEVRHLIRGFHAEKHFKASCYGLFIMSTAVVEGLYFTVNCWKVMSHSSFWKNFQITVAVCGLLLPFVEFFFPVVMEGRA